jgi:hypothetical protein
MCNFPRHTSHLGTGSNCRNKRKERAKRERTGREACIKDKEKGTTKERNSVRYKKKNHKTYYLVYCIRNMNIQLGVKNVFLVELTTMSHQRHRRSQLDG